MRVLFWYCDRFAWTPTIKTLEHVADAAPDVLEKVVVAFVHVEPQDNDLDIKAQGHPLARIYKEF